MSFWELFGGCFSFEILACFWLFLFFFGLGGGDMFLRVHFFWRVPCCLSSLFGGGEPFCWRVHVFLRGNICLGDTIFEGYHLVGLLPTETNELPANVELRCATNPVPQRLPDPIVCIALDATTIHGNQP